MTQYVLEKDNFVFAGPNAWNTRLYQAYIEQDFDLNISLPLTPPTNKTDCTNGIYAYPVQQTIPPYNSLIQMLDGPYYTFDNNFAYQTFNVVYQDINHVKKNMFDIIANNRYNQEVIGTTAVIQNTTIKVDTDRIGRNIYLQALQIQTVTSWKLYDVNNNIVFLTLQLADLQIIVTAILTHINQCFQWEENLHTTINAITDITQLPTVNLVYSTGN